MIRVMKGSTPHVTPIFVMISIMIVTVSAAYSADSSTKSVKSPSQSEAKIDSSDWKKIVDAAKKEGKIVICGDPGEAWRKSLVDLFQQDYPEITVEYTGLVARNFFPRLRQEREIGKRLWDLRAGGAAPPAYAAKKDGFLDPIRPLLLPEIADDSKWIGGFDSIFYDKEKKFLPVYTIYVQLTTAVNRDFIKESELKSSGQLLDSKFKGRIVIQTPTSGASFFALNNLGIMYGEKFLRDLLSKQKVVVTDDNRQQTEWVVRGKLPIAIGFDDTQLIPYVKQGLGRNVARLEDKIIPVGTGIGGVALVKDAPHPNAAIVYINWLLSQKTQMKLSRNVERNSRRTDVPAVDKDTAVDLAHLSRYYHYSKEENVEIAERIAPLIKESLRY